jgi:hypothetical protein
VVKENMIENFYESTFRTRGLGAELRVVWLVFGKHNVDKLA